MRLEGFGSGAMTDDELKELVAGNARAIADLRESSKDLGRKIEEEVKASKNLRTAIERTHDIVIGNTKRIGRMEGREIDLWGNHLDVEEKIRALENRIEALENKQ